MGLLRDGTYGISGPRHRMAGWLSKSTPFGKFEVLRHLLRGCDSILDVGCGTGMMQDWLINNDLHSVDYYGVDLSDHFLSSYSSAHPHVKNRIAKYDAISGLPKGPFDVVASFGLTSDVPGEEEAGKLLRNMVDAAKDVVVLEFWNKDTFKPIGDGIPPQSWDVRSINDMANRVCDGMDVNLIDPLNWSDFAIVIFKG